MSQDDILDDDDIILHITHDKSRLKKKMTSKDSHLKNYLVLREEKSSLFSGTCTINTPTAFSV